MNTYTMETQAMLTVTDGDAPTFTRVGARLATRSIRMALGLASVGLVMAACGSTSSSSLIPAATTSAPAATTTAAPTATTADASKVTLKAALTGTGETVPGAPNGTGTASVVLDATGGQICYDISVTNVEAPTAAHIHEGAAGVAGPVVVPFTAPASGQVKECKTGVDKALIARIVADPAGFYVNVHNAAYPQGAVRAQLSK